MFITPIRFRLTTNMRYTPLKPIGTRFPRSPQVLDLDFMGENIFIINNHLKCCGDEILKY